MCVCVCVCRQACGEMAADGLSAPHAGHQLLVPAVPLAGAEVHAGPRALPAEEDPHPLQLQHGHP